MASHFSSKYPAKPSNIQFRFGWVPFKRSLWRSAFSQPSIFLCFVSFVATKEMKKQFESKQLLLSIISL
jgi:hypothetical protein